MNFAFAQKLDDLLGSVFPATKQNPGFAALLQTFFGGPKVPPQTVTKANSPDTTLATAKPAQVVQTGDALHDLVTSFNLN